jgi:hypothetical protein
VWPQCWDLQGPRGLEQRDLRNLNLGDLKKGPKGGVSPTPQKNLDKYPCLEWDSNSRFQCSKQAKTVHASDSAATVNGP